MRRGEPRLPAPPKAVDPGRKLALEAVRLRLSTRPSVRPDTIVELTVIPQELTFPMLGHTLTMRVLFAMVALAPLGLLLGAAFPLGIRALSALRPETVPWAFAINACCTVLGSAGAVVLALLFGFPATFLAAAGVYVVALLAMRGFAYGLRV